MAFLTERAFWDRKQPGNLYDVACGAVPQEKINHKVPAKLDTAFSWATP